MLTVSHGVRADGPGEGRVAQTTCAVGVVHARCPIHALVTVRLTAQRVTGFSRKALAVVIAAPRFWCLTRRESGGWSFYHGQAIEIYPSLTLLGVFLFSVDRPYIELRSFDGVPY